MKCPLGPHVLARMAWMPRFPAGPVWAGSPPRWPGTQPSLALCPSVLSERSAGALFLPAEQQWLSPGPNSLCPLWCFSRDSLTLPPPLLVINMHLMSLFSEPWWLFYHHHHHRYFCHKNISNSISSYHGNFPLNHPVWVKAWRGCAQSVFFPLGTFYWKWLGKKRAKDHMKRFESSNSCATEDTQNIHAFIQQIFTKFLWLVRHHSRFQKSIVATVMFITKSLRNETSQCAYV